MSKNCLLCGVGGQGVILASKLIACAAMEQDSRCGLQRPSGCPSGAAVW